MKNMYGKYSVAGLKRVTTIYGDVWKIELEIQHSRLRGFIDHISGRYPLRPKYYTRKFIQCGHQWCSNDGEIIHGQKALITVLDSIVHEKTVSSID